MELPTKAEGGIWESVEQNGKNDAAQYNNKVYF